MSKQRLNATIKTRVTRDTKREISRVAKVKKLEKSDIQREAFQFYLNNEPVAKEAKAA